MEIDSPTKEFRMGYRKRARISMGLDQGNDKNQKNAMTIGNSPSSYSAGGHPIFSTSYATVPFQKLNVQTPTPTSTVEQEEEDIYDTFMEIKRSNEVLKTNTYNKFWKQTSSSQSRPLSTFDSDKGRMRIAFLEAQVPRPKGAAD